MHFVIPGEVVLITSRTLHRQLTIGLGLGTIAFAAVPLVFPRKFARWFGIPLNDSPAADVAIRSVSARDVVSGIGIISAAVSGGRVAPWLLARTLIDGSDAVAVGLAVASGASNVRLILLGAIALAAAATDLTLYLESKSTAKLAAAGLEQ
jgi:hypothetical protein